MPHAAFQPRRTLPETLPESPFPLFQAWYDEAHELAAQPNPSAMCVATVDEQGRPSSRMVLCRGIDTETGSVRFFTNRTSRKGQEIASSDPARVALLMHWDHLDLQVRIEGIAIETTDAESDEYWASRRAASKAAAWASDQSAPIASRDELTQKLHSVCDRFDLDPDAPEKGDDLPRPPHWGGYRVHAERVELWAGSDARFHDRAAWTRTLTPTASGTFNAGPWTTTRLQP